jgi:NADPH-dependent 2,4-dienoyl-CoA reductase/sulfur reductase-like enzyme
MTSPVNVTWSLASNGRVVVVGGSLAGLRTAESLRAKGFAGSITILSEETIAPYDRPPLSKQFLTGTWDHERIALRSTEELTGLHLDLRLGVHATGVDLAGRIVHGVVNGVGQSFSYDALVVATGVRARELPASLIDTGVQKPSVHTVRTRGDSESLQPLLVEGAKIVVIGAGFIGAEVAAAASAKGCSVTIIEQLPIPLSRALGEAMGFACGSLHGRHGVTLRCGVELIAITNGCVFLGDGSTLAADVVVAGIGTIPNTEWLQNCDIDAANGVRVDEYCQALSSTGSVIPGVFAVGDIALFPLDWPRGDPRATEPVGYEPSENGPAGNELVRIEHWTNAAEMASHLAGVLNGEILPYAPVPYFWSDQYNHKIQFLGRAHPSDEVCIVSGSVEEGAWLALYRNGDRLTAALGVSKVRGLVPYRALLASGCSWDEALAAAPQP